MKRKALLKAVEKTISELQLTLAPAILAQGKLLFEQGNCQILFQSDAKFEYLMDACDEPISLQIATYDKEEGTDTKEFITIYVSGEEWDEYNYACLLQMQQTLTDTEISEYTHKQYSRAGMIRRVLEERRVKALHAEYRIKWADNIYGDHILSNESGVKYKIFLRDFENETGYSNSKDSAVNKLGTTKHIMFAFSALKQNKSLFKRLKKTCPFVEIYCDPLNNYAIKYFYTGTLTSELQKLLNPYFSSDGFLKEEAIPHMADFINEAQDFETIVIRPEVNEFINRYFENKALESIQKNYVADYSAIKANLYAYQKEGISFGIPRKHAIIADEMGLGKTLQAISIAVLKKDLFGFKKTLIVCPASLKAQWKTEIEKFTNEKAEIIEGYPDERAQQYQNSNAYFSIVNYETVLRDQRALNKAKIDFLILDEAQKVKNYATKTASAIKSLDRKHVLIITGTPIENKLIDLFSLMAILDPHLLGPLWEFSYQYCLFDTEKPNKINAYYNLNQLKEVLKPVLLRREKHKVLEQLPNVQQQDVPVKMTPLQADFHASYASGIGQITNKKFLTPFDLQRLQQLLTAMRMVCNSTYLVDESTNDSPKLDELEYILLEKLDLKHQNRKVIIFSEWVKTHKLIGQMLLKNNIGFSELNGSVPTKKRGELIKKFERDKDCKVFLSTEAGGAGLNLQVADILINFELPWNPAKKNQRIGRIDRIGQKSSKLTIFNLVTSDSIETRIALGLLVKQNLFDNVLNEEHNSDFVDFTEKGRGQFLEQMKELADNFDEVKIEASDIEEQNEKAETTDEQIIRNEKEEDFADVVEKDEALSEIEAEIEDETEIEAETNTEISTTPSAEDKESASKTPPSTQENTAAQMEQVLQNGMQFLSGLMQMATGKNVGIENQEIKVNKETGEVTMKFKLPTF